MAASRKGERDLFFFFFAPRQCKSQDQRATLHVFSYVVLEVFHKIRFSCWESFSLQGQTWWIHLVLLPCWVLSFPMLFRAKDQSKLMIRTQNLTTTTHSAEGHKQHPHTT